MTSDNLSDPSDIFFDFNDLTPVRIPVRYGGRLYLLVDASEDTAIKFRNRAARTARVADGKVVGVEAVAELQSYLLSLCLVETDESGNPRLRPDGKTYLTLPQEVLTQWPSRVIRPLFDKCKEVSRLGEMESPAAVRAQIKHLRKVLEAMGEENSAGDEPDGGDPRKNGRREGTTTTSASP